MKLYTRTGDAGQTSLFGGQRVNKDDARVEAYGTVDELSSILGIVLSQCDDTTISDILTTVQHRLFEIGADLATPRTDETRNNSSASASVPRVEQRHIAELEQWIDQASSDLPTMRYFILPGGTATAAHLHHARTVCRRAERRIVSLASIAPVGDMVITYVNRLSDLLFALARRANHKAGRDDVPWNKPD